MALLVYWYDFVCFGIVGVAFFGAVWVLRLREGSRKLDDDNTMYQSLAIGRPETDRAPALGHVGSGQLWASCWRGLHPGWLLGVRVGSFLVLSGFLAWDIKLYDASIFVYYTEWTFTLVILYFAIGSIVSAHGCVLYYKKKRNVEERKEEESGFMAQENWKIIQLGNYDDPNRGRAGFWGYLMQTSYQTCAGAVILTDVFFWFLIVPVLSIAHLKLDMLMGCMHTLNAVFLLIDTSLNSLPFPWFSFSYFVLWSCCYVVFEWIIHACGLSWWPYPFLELSTPWAPLWYFLLAVAHIPCYGLYSLLVKLKILIFSKFFPNSFVQF